LRAMAMKDQTDAELAADALAGNRFAFEELVRRYRDAAFGLAMSLARNPEDAADMAQEAFVQAWLKLDRYDPSRSFKSWLLRICANRTKNLFRRRARRRAMEERFGTHLEIERDGAEEPEEGRERMEAALRRLPGRFSAPLRLKYVEGMSYDEVAKTLGIGTSAAKMRVARAKKKLRECLDDEGDE